MSSESTSSSEILLATDFCEPARRALACAKLIGRRRSAPVRALHVLNLTGEPGPTRSAAVRQRSFLAAHDSAERALREIRRELRLAGIESTATLVSAGQAAPTLRTIVSRQPPSLLLLGLNGTRHRTALGATTRALLTAHSCPIMTVGACCPERLSASSFDRMLFVVDTDPDSLHRALAAWPPAPSQPSPPIVAILPRTTRPAWDPPPSMKRRLRPIRVLDHENAADTVLRIATEIAAGVIVVSYRSRGSLDSLGRGALLHTLLTQVSCPVLTTSA